MQMDGRKGKVHGKSKVVTLALLSTCSLAIIAMAPRCARTTR
jgi:hypothetical protein